MLFVNVSHALTFLTPKYKNNYNTIIIYLGIIFHIFSDNNSYLVFKPAFGPMYLGPELITCS